MSDLIRLAELLKEKHLIDEKIANLVGRPAQIGHVGEYIAAAIFGITLEASAVNAGYDGRFIDRPLRGRTVDIKWYAKLEGLHNINPAHLPNEYLVMTGPRTAAASSRGTHRPWVLHYVFLFDAHELARCPHGAWIKIECCIQCSASVLGCGGDLPGAEQQTIIAVGRTAGNARIFPIARQKRRAHGCAPRPLIAHCSLLRQRKTPL